MATPNPKQTAELTDRLKVLNPRWIRLVDRSLAWVGAYGEVRLSLGDGELTGVKATRSYDALRGLPAD